MAGVSALGHRRLAPGDAVSAGDTCLLALDWGTTLARAYRLGRGGAVLDQRAAPLGIQQVRDGAFASALDSLLGDWRSLDAPRVACGMIGSRQGWIEAPYLECPVALRALARGMVATPGGELRIVAGLTCRDPAGVPDVMRGEETQIAGMVEPGDEAALVVQPGTHSKWTITGHVQAGEPGIRAFASFMTGETFAVLREHSILGRLMASTDVFDRKSFMRGVERGLAGTSGGELLHQVFGARTLALMNELPATGIADYLSGLLIGAEIVAGRTWASAQGVQPGVIWLAGGEELCARYAAAFERASILTRAAPADVAARGLWQLAVHAGIVEQGNSK